VVLNLVAACQALGTLLALGMMMIPAVTARLWTKQVWSLILLSVLIAMVSGYLGLVFSYRFNWPSGPTIILVAGCGYIIALLLKAAMPTRRYVATT
jgi:zinc/manganese transport system permease protein